MADQNILVLDLGSSSTRAMIFDARANLISPIARQPVEFVIRQDGASEDDATEAVRRTERVITQLKQQVGHLPENIAISSYAGSLLCLGDDGEPLAPLMTYADTRASHAAAQLRLQHDELACLQRTGCRIRANYSPARIAWLSQSQPALFARTCCFASMSDYVRAKLLGTRTTGISIASWTGLLNRASGDWDAHWLAALRISRHQLPPISSQLVALGDGAAANLGSGCTQPGRIAITMGTTSAARVSQPHSSGDVAHALWSYRVSREMDLVGGALTEGGSAHAWATKTLGIDQPALADNAINKMKPDAHGLTVLPPFAGERSPGFADFARATLHGLSLDTSRFDILRALMESIALRIGLVYESVRDYSLKSSRRPELIASGGALLASPAWCQMIADVCDAPLTLCEEPEATARGAALMALGLPESDIEPKLGRTFQPVAAHHAIYQQAQARQQRLYQRLIGNRFE